MRCVRCARARPCACGCGASGAAAARRAALTVLCTTLCVAAACCVGNFVDLSRPAPRTLLRSLLAAARTDGERAVLQRVGDVARHARAAGSGAHLPSTAEVISRVSPALLARIHVSDLYGLLPPMQPRLYSISSSATVSPTRASIACGRALHWDAHRIQSFVGCASRYVARAHCGEDALVFYEASDFTIGANGSVDDGNAPLLLIANGSGMAPCRAFIADRVARGCTAPTYLLYGCMYPEHDFLYRAEIEEWAAQGRVELHMAYSHWRRNEERGGALRFVQHLLAPHEPAARRLWELMRNEADNGRIFLCGTPEMGTGVFNALDALATSHGYVGARGADGAAIPWTAMLKGQRRFFRDVFK